MKTLILGTRGSLLARTQSKWVAQRVQHSDPQVHVEIHIIQTKGDHDQSRPLPDIGGKGLFTQELDDRLLNCDIDFAVHSMKDLPTGQTAGIAVLAVPQREWACDALVSRKGQVFADLPMGARIGTGSIRRQAQLKHIRSDLEYCNIRGNVDTRVRKLQHGDYDAIVLAAAGLRRLGLAKCITECFGPDVVLSAVGQGALALTGRMDDEGTRAVLEQISHHPTSQAVAAERAVLSTLGGGCHVPIAAHATVQDGLMHIAGLVASPDGQQILRDRFDGDAQHAEKNGRRLAEMLLSKGAGEILAEFT